MLCLPRDEYLPNACPPRAFDPQTYIAQSKCLAQSGIAKHVAPATSIAPHSASKRGLRKFKIL
ncbi:hypothetical protein [uncultured Campylobacter sp.]|uniref:hypothetical protein n=1 Tax=uncultured Campylobacter sp. TaxID=218934 RepID=UPI002613D2BB|nr:hypothetical protein [uncultured Campylobacter sp.]